MRFLLINTTSSDSARRCISLLLLPTVLAMFNGCSSEGTEAETLSGAGDQQSAFRIRDDFDAELNANTGWAAELNQTATVQADQPFRLRLELEHAGPERQRSYSLQVRRNNGDWEPMAAENFPQPAKKLTLDFEDQSRGALEDHWHLIPDQSGTLSWLEKGDESHLKIQANDAPLLALARYHTYWKPVEFASDIRFPAEETTKAGLVFDYQDEANYHRVDLEPGRGVALVQVRDGKEQTLANETFEVETGRWSELKIILDGPEVTVEYDDKVVVLRKRLDTRFAPRLGVFVAEGGTLELPGLAIEGLPRSPRTSIIEAGTFSHGDATTDVLSGSDQPFVGGAGVSFAKRTPGIAAAAGQSEWEYPLVIRRFSDKAALNETGDRFEFRLIEADGRIVPASYPATVTLQVPRGHLGGTFVETPARIGPWEAENGDLYFLMEPAETDNVLMTVKSIDGGESWVEMDGANRPVTGDLEGFASVLAGNHIHMLHQTSDHVFYHVFRTSDHPDMPDSWAIRDERLASPEEPPTQVADIAVRSDGTVVAVYGGPEKIHYQIRSSEGQWSGETVIDANHQPNLSGPMLVRGPDDVVHLAYTGSDGTAWYRQLRPDGDLTPRRQIADGLGTNSEDIGSILPLVYLKETKQVSVIYRLSDGTLWERRIDTEGRLAPAVQVTRRAVAQNTVDSDQAGADTITDGANVHVLFIEADTGKLFHTYREPDQKWTEARLQVDTANVQWVRGALISSPEEGPVYGYVFDAGSDGGSGKNRFAKIPLDASKDEQH